MSTEERKTQLEDGELDDEEEENVETATEVTAATTSLTLGASARALSPVEIEMVAAARDSPPPTSSVVLNVGPAMVISTDSIMIPVPTAAAAVVVAPQTSFTSIYDQYGDEDEDDDDDDDYGLGGKRLKIDESEEPAANSQCEGNQEDDGKSPEAPQPSGQLVATDVASTPGIASMSSSSVTGQIDIKLDRASVGMTVIDALVDPSTVISTITSKLPDEPAVVTKAAAPVQRSELEHDNESSSSSAVSAISAISSASLPTSEVSNDAKNAAAAEEKVPSAQEDTSKEGASSPATAAVADNAVPPATTNADAVVSVPASSEPLDIEPDTGDMSNAAVISGDTVSSVNSFKSFEETGDKAKSDEQPAQEPSKSEEQAETKSTPPEAPNPAGNLKVPPLKIICSNATGMAYVKTTSEIESEKKSTSGEETTSAAELSDDCSKDKADQPDLTSQLSNDSVSTTTTRSKASRTARDISSPVPTTQASGANGSKTSTRRSGAVGPAAVASVGRASPSANLLSSPILTASTSAGNGGFDTTGMTAAEVETANRRKLRSHTRQQHGGDPSDPSPLTVRSASAGPQSTGTKSPSPVNVMNENTNSNNSTNGGNGAAGLEDAAASSKATNPPPCECSNDSTAMDTSSSEMQPSVQQQSGTTDPSSSRRRRTRNGAAQAIEPAEMEPASSAAKHLPAISETESSEVKPTVEFTSMTSVEPINLMTISSSEGTSSATSSTTETESMAAHDETSAPQQQPPPNDQQPPVVNCIRKFMELKNEIRKKHEAVEAQIEPRLPKEYKEFLLFNRQYLIKSNEEARQSILIHQPPSDLPEELKKFFIKQENERCSMITRHRVERHKLKIMQEHETMRCYNRFVRESTGQAAPFSFCTMVKDEEIYSLYRNIPTEQQLQAILLGTTPPPPQAPAATATETDPASTGDQPVPPPPAPPVPPEPSFEEKLTTALNDLETKFNKLRDDTAKRHLIESDSLNAVQKMDFQSKLKEFMNKHKQAAEAKSTGASQSNTHSHQEPPAITLSTPSAVTLVKN